MKQSENIPEMKIMFSEYYDQTNHHFDIISNGNKTSILKNEFELLKY